MVLYEKAYPGDILTFHDVQFEVRQDQRLGAVDIPEEEDLSNLGDEIEDEDILSTTKKEKPAAIINRERENLNT